MAAHFFKGASSLGLWKEAGRSRVVTSVHQRKDRSSCRAERGMSERQRADECSGRLKTSWQWVSSHHCFEDCWRWERWCCCDNDGVGCDNDVMAMSEVADGRAASQRSDRQRRLQPQYFLWRRWRRIAAASQKRDCRPLPFFVAACREGEKERREEFGAEFIGRGGF